MKTYGPALICPWLTLCVCAPAKEIVELSEFS